MQHGGLGHLSSLCTASQPCRHRGGGGRWGGGGEGGEGGGCVRHGGLGHLSLLCTMLCTASR